MAEGAESLVIARAALKTVCEVFEGSITFLAAFDDEDEDEE